MADAVRMADIAAMLGISTVSVSKALSGDKGVSEETREKVRQAAAKMGYRGPLRQRKDHGRPITVGILIPARYLDTTETFYLHLYQEAAQQASRLNCRVLMEILEDGQAQNGEKPQLLSAYQTEGLILLGKPPYDYAARMRDQWDKPVVYLDFSAPEADMDAILSNNVYGTAALTEYLIAKGHREIGFLGTLNVTDSINDRYLGYCRAMIRNRLPLRSEWRLDDRDAGSGNDFELPLPEKLPTAFVCNCDAAAGRLIGALAARGLRVPDDVSVVGFDDYLPDAVSTVPLTTWAADTGEMARLALETLIRRVRGETGYPLQQITNGHLVLRDTVKDIS